MLTVHACARLETSHVGLHWTTTQAFGIASAAEARSTLECCQCRTTLGLAIQALAFIGAIVHASAGLVNAPEYACDRCGLIYDSPKGAQTRCMYQDACTGDCIAGVLLKLIQPCFYLALVRRSSKCAPSWVQLPQLCLQVADACTAVQQVLGLLPSQCISA